MTPKSASGTSLIVALAAMFLIPAWGLTAECDQFLIDYAVRDERGVFQKMLVSVAGRSQDNLGMCIVAVTRSVLRTGDQPTRWREAPGEIHMTCEHRMREAMRAANTYLNGPWNQAWSEYGKWQQTMKDCVEGK